MKAALDGLDAVNGDLSDDQEKYREALTKPEARRRRPARSRSTRTARRSARHFITEVAKGADGIFYNKVVKVVPKVDQTLGLLARTSSSRWVSARATSRAARKRRRTAARTAVSVDAPGSRGPAEHDAMTPDHVRPRRDAARHRRRPRARGRHPARSARCARIDDMSFCGGGGRAARGARRQRRRQDHAVQRHHRRLPADARAASASSARTSPTCRRTSASAGTAAHLPVSLLFRGLTVRDNLFLAVRGVARGRFASAGRARRTRRAQATDELLERVRLDAVARAPGRRACRTASSASSRSAWRWPARRASSCSTSRPPACRRPSGASWSRSSTALPAAHRLRHHRARPRRRAARRRAGHHHAQRPGAQARHAAARSRTTPRCRRSTWAEAGT